MSEISIREARPTSTTASASSWPRCLARSQASGPTEQPRYYELLANVGVFATRPDTQLLVAVLDDRVVGGVVYFADVANYGSGR